VSILFSFQILFCCQKKSPTIKHNNPKKKQMDLEIFKKSKNARILLSIAIGLVLVLIYFKVCSGGRCVLIKPKTVPSAPNDTPCHFPARTAAHVSGGTFQDPGYGSGSGSLGAVYEGFNVECLGLNQPNKGNDINPYQVSNCYKEPIWNLPRDARAEHQAVYPCGVPGQMGPPKCQRRHPMDSIYHPPNEGVMF
jgi:hypothetical protein